MDGFDDADQFDNLRINSWEDDALEQYVNDLDKNENIQNEKDLCSQKLFQSFQNSACGVAQMYKDKSQPWNSFQNTAGSITILYKESLEACKVNYDLGVNIGQQRKIKELVNWLRKKKRRVIRKDELINFLIGNNTQTQRAQYQQMQANSGQQQPVAVTNNSDLATFREALIMHNRTRDNINHNNHHHHHHNHNQNIHNSHHHQHQNPFFTSTTHQQQTNHNCDDLDCFFCEQIATYKRPSCNMDSESPTRKRGRFDSK